MTKKVISITNLIILINVLIFILIEIHPGTTYKNYIYNLYGMNPITLTNPIVWITNMFLHGGIIHILFNMFALWDLGNAVEEKIGKLKFLTIYFISGLGASLFTYITLSTLHININVIGASGAIFGVYAYYAMLFNKEKEFLMVFFIFHLFLVLTGTINGIAWYAHIGGSIAGYILSMFIRPSYIIPFKKV